MPTAVRRSRHPTTAACSVPALAAFIEPPRQREVIALRGIRRYIPRTPDNAGGCRPIREKTCAPKSNV
jgi:hypothetical protein